MGLIWEDDAVRLQLGDDWIDLKKELSSGDEDAVYEALYRAETGDPGNEKVVISFRVTALNRARVRRSIVAWSYTRNGEPVPVTDENIDRLDKETYERVVEKVDELNPFEPRKKRTASKSTSLQPSSVDGATTRR